MTPSPQHCSTSVAQFIPVKPGHSCKVKAICSFFVALLLTIPVLSQDSIALIKNTDTTNLKDAKIVTRLHHSFPPSNEYPYNKKRVRFIAVANVVGYSGVMAGLYATWYKNYPQSKFHVFNDLPEWKQIDKMGHSYSAYAAGKASMELWRWTGMERKKRIWIGGMSGAVYQTVIEVLDGFSSEWGWSWGDIGANFIGSGLLIGQELAWDEQRIQFKWSFHRKKYTDGSLNARTDKIFGKTTPERFLKDYNGQTYWLSASPRAFFPHSGIPAWLQVSVGTGAEGLFGATENVGKDKNGNIEFSRPDIKRYRQWYLAPDIDLTRIKTNKKGIKLALMILNIFKFPTPSLEYSNGSMKFNWFHF